jgi:hypothetical protein
VKFDGFYQACCKNLIAFRKDRKKDVQTEHRETYMWIRGMNFGKKKGGKAIETAHMWFVGSAIEFA